MNSLVNLLSWLPGNSGFGSYVKRVIPGIPGTRLQLDTRGRSLFDSVYPVVVASTATGT